MNSLEMSGSSFSGNLVFRTQFTFKRVSEGQAGSHLFFFLLIHCGKTVASEIFFFMEINFSS